MGTSAAAGDGRFGAACRLDVPAFGEWWSGELIAPQGSDTGYDMFEPPATKNRLQMTVRVSSLDAQPAMWA
eukprot:SAG11_NODE_679_length_7786_cov_6.173670_5_plen_71_part_00